VRFEGPAFLRTQLHALGMESGQLLAVRDTDDGGVLQALDDRLVELLLTFVVEVGGGSSRNNQVGLCNSARANATRCCSPPDSCTAQLATSSRRGAR
jgi:hypothetical protein